MRNADLATLFRIPLLFLAAYSVIMRFNPIAVIFLIVLLFLSDTFDGYLATLGRHSFPDYISYLLEEATGRRSPSRKFPPNPPGYAAYFDIALDRLIDYAFWLLFSFLSILPLFVFVVVFIRNTLADFLVIRKKKDFSKMKTGFGRVASSHFIRGVNGGLKAINFMYLSLVYITNWPINIGYLLTGVTVFLILLRGVAEIYESLI